jgi:hypothetical protein
MAREARALASVDEVRLIAERRADLDGAFEHIEHRLSGAVDFDVVLRAAHGQEGAGRLHEARLAAEDLVEHRVNTAALEREDHAGRAAGELDVGDAEDLELRVVRFCGNQGVGKKAGVDVVAALRLRAFRGLRLPRRCF